MDKSTTLFLHEEVILLALRDKEGTIATGSLFNFAVAGGILGHRDEGHRHRGTHHDARGLPHPRPRPQRGGRAGR